MGVEGVGGVTERVEREWREREGVEEGEKETEGKGFSRSEGGK